MIDNEEKEIKQLTEFINAGAEIAGTAGGSLLGALTGDIISVVAGAVIGSSFAKAFQMLSNEFAYRQLSKREEKRIGAGLTFALTKIIEHQKIGDNPRTDGFFENDFSGNSPSQEILEGSLLKCKNEPDEKKCRYYAYIFANVAYRTDISPASAHYFLRLAEQLTYRQLCLIALVGKSKEEKTLLFSWGNYLSSNSLNHSDPSFIEEQRSLSYLIHAMGSTSDPPFLEGGMSRVV